MSSHIASIHLAGNMASRPEMKHNSKTATMATFRLAVNHRYQDRAGAWKSAETTFITVQCWGKLAQNVVANGYLGMPILVIGRMYQSSWTRKNDEGKEEQFSALRIRASHIGPDMNVVAVSAYREEKQGNPKPDSDDDSAETKEDLATATTTKIKRQAKIGDENITHAAEGDTASADRELVGAGAGSSAKADLPF